MEKLAHSIAVIIATKLNYDQDKKAVIEYGLIAIFQIVSIFIVSSIIGFFAGFWVESMVIFLAVGLLRKSTGGAHSQTMLGCLIISIISISFMAFIATYLIPISFKVNIYILFPLIFLIFAFCFIVAYQLVPVDSPNKPITKKEKIFKLRRNTFLTLFIYFIIAEILVCFSKSNVIIDISICLCFATLWQAFTLTKTGHIIVGTIDSKFR